MDKNIKKLLVSAFRLVSASVFFKEKLLLRLKEELARLTKGVSRRPTSSPALEENLGRLLASAITRAEAAPGFKDRLRYQLLRKEAVEPTRRRLPLRAPALATAVAVVLLLGMVIYPNFWADRGDGAIAAVNQGTGVVTQTKPLFFTLGSRVATSSLATGDTVLLAEGDRITVDPDSMVVVTLFNESSLKLYPCSELVIGELKAQDENSLPAVGVRLETGLAANQINRLQFEMATPAAITTVLGTAFRVEVVDSDHTFLATDEGFVQLTMDGNTVQVSAGEEVHAIKGQPLVVHAQRPPSLIIDSSGYPEVSSSPITLSGRTDAEATVTVNGEPVTVDPNGAFCLTVDLEPGANPIAVVATSPVGKTTTVNLIFILEQGE